MSARQRILITGASSGLGAELARNWAADGRDLALCARRLPELEKLRDELLAANPERTIGVYPLDVTDPAAVTKVFRSAEEDLGGLDRVVVNAGVGVGGPIGKGYADDNRRTLQTNVIGTFNCCEQAIETFRDAAAGHLVIISSMAALRGMRGAMAAYSTSKAAIGTLGEAIRSTVWNKPITVSTIYPGYIDTALSDGLPDKKWSTDLATGGRALLKAIEDEPAKAYVPTRPWALLAPLMRMAPLGVFRRMGG